jgi:hypothetical protein
MKLATFTPAHALVEKFPAIDQFPDAWMIDPTFRIWTTFGILGKIYVVQQAAFPLHPTVAPPHNDIN